LLPALAIPALPAPGTLDPRTLFPRSFDAIWLEIGFGGGEHLIGQATANPRIAFLGAEPFVNGLARLLAEAPAIGLDRLRVWTEDGADLLTALASGSIGRAFLLFSDPWPKTRHHKRRVVSTANVAQLARVLAPGAELRLTTDDAGYLTWMLERLADHPDLEWSARRPSDWRNRPADWPETRYESKARAAGRPAYYLLFRRRVPRP
jgi:tRNA (guanine-N7-)-methyltransferase